jgi:hypothetical protein
VRRRVWFAAIGAVVVSGRAIVAADPPADVKTEPQPMAAQSVPPPTPARAELAPVAKPRPTAADLDPPWIQTSSEDRITTFKRDVHNSSIIALRGVGVVDAPIVRVASVLLDYRRATEWIDSLEDTRVVRMLSATEFIEYDHVGTPPLIMKDRDFVCRGRIEVDLPDQTLTMNLWPTTDPSVPPGKYVRGTLRGYWKLRAIEQGKKTEVTTEMHGDPKGGVAKWLVNFFQKGWPRNTLESLRAQVAKRDIHIVPQIAAVFEGKPLDLVSAQPTKP